MKTTIKFLISFSFMLLFFVACKPKDVSPAEAIIGKWKWTAVNNKGLTTKDFADWQTFQKSFASVIFEFKSDNTYTISGYSGSQPYSLNGSTLTLKDTAGTVTISSTTMTWEDTDDKVEYVFTKQ